MTNRIHPLAVAVLLVGVICTLVYDTAAGDEGGETDPSLLLSGSAVESALSLPEEMQEAGESLWLSNSHVVMGFADELIVLHPDGVSHIYHNFESPATAYSLIANVTLQQCTQAAVTVCGEGKVCWVRIRMDECAFACQDGSGDCPEMNSLLLP
ncbi:MAG: hypothetical protein EA377_10455 [Phycisphaerales bacterium]|nr:MAG: hypothetical protein EA377_10455 [Phycisphaerales bacterium]